MPDPEGIGTRHFTNHAIAKVQRILLEIRQRCLAHDGAVAIHDADLIHAAVHERELFPTFEHRHAVRFRTFGACDGFVLHDQLLRRIKHRQAAPMRIRDATVR